MSNPIHSLSVNQLPDSWSWPFRWVWRFKVDGINYCLRRKRFNKGWILRFRKGCEQVTVESPWASFEPKYITVNGYKWELDGMYSASWGPLGHLPTDPPCTFLPPQVVSVVNTALEDTAAALAAIVKSQKDRLDRRDEARRLVVQAREQAAHAKRRRKFAATMSRIE